jgi:hypothetical protein
MARIAQSRIGSFRWFTGLLALGLVVLMNLQTAFVATAIWLATTHGHEHQIAVHADGNQLKVRLAHSDDLATTDHDHEPLSPFVAALLSTHGQDGNEHVLHFGAGEVPDQIKTANVITPSHPQQWTLPFTSLKSTVTVAETTPPESAARPPPRLTAGLLCLRTTVLLI